MADPVRSFRALSYLDNETLTDLTTDLVVANNNNINNLVGKNQNYRLQVVLFIPEIILIMSVSVPQPKLSSSITSA